MERSTKKAISLLKDVIEDVIGAFRAVLPWSIFVLTPFFYGLGIFLFVIVLGYFGALIAIIYLIGMFIPIAFVMYKAIKREEETQVIKYVDRWEGSEEKQREALNYIISKAKKKKTAQNTSVDSDSAGN
jgi:hypothetical protein